MSVWELLAAVVVGVAVGVPIGYVQFRTREYLQQARKKRRMTIVTNDTGRPEYVLTAEQWGEVDRHG